MAITTMKHLDVPTHEAVRNLPLSRPERAKVMARIVRDRYREWLVFDCIAARRLIAFVGLMIALPLWVIDRRRSLDILSKIHRSAYSEMVSRVTERLLRDSLGGGAEGLSRESAPRRALIALHEVIGTYPIMPHTRPLFEDPRRLLGSKVFVLKSPSERERGVVAIEYNFILPLFLRLFDVASIIRRYHLVLEPSWSGYCTPEILAYTQYDQPIFVLSSEPRDLTFIRSLRSNLVPVEVGENWWIDHRMFRPLSDDPDAKDADVIMVAAWAAFKRHEHFFAALGKLRRAGKRLRVILVGYPMDRTRGDIERLAAFYGVLDQFEIFDRIGPADVNIQLNRAKVHVLWSRREGVNRAIIEAMCANVPCIVRAGWNYGHQYAHINRWTGCYASEEELPRTLLRMVEGHRSYSPRDWVLDHITCYHAAAELGRAIRETAARSGEPWTTDLVTKHSELNGSRYWDPADAERFRADYAFLASRIRPAV